MSVTQFTRPVQIKFWRYCQSFAPHFSRPVHKFIQQMLFGILKSGTVQLNHIGRSLQENISLKKVTQRLGAHLGKPELWPALTTATLETQTPKLRQCRFVIVDLSDLSKKYAQQMEGLAGVYDGSEDEKSRGFWLCNITAVNDDATLVVPASSELFSHQAEVTSENEKLLQGITAVVSRCAAEAMVVIDRGGDRSTLLAAHLQADRQFIGRQTAKRYLCYRGKKRSFKYLTQHTDLAWTLSVERIHRNKIRQLTFEAGAIPVQLTATGKTLWLITLKRRHRGYSWFLCYFKNCPTAEAAVKLAFQGYGLRWKIEEVHRQVKMDYRWEDMRLLRYHALKNMNALLWMAVSFLYTALEKLAYEMICHHPFGLRNRKKNTDLLRFKFYKLALAMKFILALSRLYQHITFSQDADARQMILPLETSRPTITNG